MTIRIDPSDMTEMLQAAVDTLLWSECDVDDEGNGDGNFEDEDQPCWEIVVENGELELQIIEHSNDGLQPDVVTELFVDLADLCEHNEELVVACAEETSYEEIGKCFVLDRNGHGAGAQDGHISRGEELAKAARVYGTLGLYRGDDGRVYGHN